MEYTERVDKRFWTLYLYEKAFLDANLPVPDNWKDKVIEMYWSRPEDPIVLPERPPGGWLQFNKALGGLPHNKQFSPYPDKHEVYKCPKYY